MADVTCPNCGGEVVEFEAFKTMVEEEERGDVLPEDPPEGGILVCSVCSMAVDPLEEIAEPESMPAQSPEHSDTAENPDLLPSEDESAAPA